VHLQEAVLHLLDGDLLENNLVHRGDGPAVISPDGAERWYIRGKEVTRDVNTFFFQNKWPTQQGLDTAEKVALFQARFIA